MPRPLPDVPDAGDHAIVDPNHGRLLAPSGLPSFYAPETMPTQVGGWRRAAAWTVVVLLTSSSLAGICLTYGPDELLRFARQLGG